MAANTLTANSARAAASIAGSMADEYTTGWAKGQPHRCPSGVRLLSTQIAAASRIRQDRRGVQGPVRTHGIFRPAAHQRHHARLDLRPDRHRLHDGLRHHRHDQFRPWRRVHGRRLHRADRVPGADGDRHHLDPAGAVPGAADRHGADRALRLDRRAHRLPAAAPLVPPGAADLRDRHVDHPAELRADRAGRARQAAAAADHRRLHADDERRLRRATSPTSRSSSW